MRRSVLASAIATLIVGVLSTLGIWQIAVGFVAGAIASVWAKMEGLPLHWEILAFVVGFLTLTSVSTYSSEQQRRRRKRGSVIGDELGNSRLTLARLRTTGVQIRNKGQKFHDDYNLHKWVDEVIKWAGLVEDEIRKIDPADAELFKTLDAVPPPRVPFEKRSQLHEKHYREHDYRLIRLDELIQKYG